jgi:hypothetical protein
VVPGRLAALGAELGESPEAVARILHTELTRAFAALDEGLTVGDPTAVADAAHAARNSLLMLDEAALLTQLSTLDTAARDGDLATARTVRGELGAGWARLASALHATAQPAAG